MNTWLRRIVLTGIFLVPLIPFVIANPFFFPFITGKNFAFRIIVEIIFTAWLLLAFRDPAYRPKWSALPIVLLAFLGSAGVSAFLAENPVKAFWSNFERMEGWVALLHSTAYFFVVYLSLNAEKLWDRFWNTSIVASAVMGVYGLMQLGGVFQINQGGVRVDGTFGNATYLAVYMLFHVFLTVLYMVRNWNQGFWHRAAYSIALVLQLVMVFFTATRGTIGGVVGGFLVLGVLMLFFNKGNDALKKWGIGAAIAILVAIGGFIAIKDTPFVQQDPVLSRLASISLEEGKTRFTIWGMAFEGFKERPILGWGQEGFNYVFNQNYKPSLYAQEPWFDRAHNAFIDWLIAGGIIGFSLYSSFYVLALWLIWRKESTFSVFEKSIFTSLLAAYGFHNLFVFDNLISYVFFMTVLAYVLFKSPKGESKPGTAMSTGTFAAVAPVVLLVMAFAFYFVNVPGMATASNLIQGLSPQCVQANGTPVSCEAPGATRDIKRNFEYFKQANQTSGLGRQEAREQTVQFAVQVRSLNAGDTAFHTEVAQYALTQMEDEIQRAPNDARLYTFMGSFWRQLGNADEALKNLNRALELSPGKQQILFEIAVIENDRGNFVGALEVFKKAYELDSSFDNALIFYAVTALRAGEKALGESLILEKFGTLMPDNDYVLQAYLDIKDYGKATGIAEARVTSDPQNAERRVQLAAAYLAAGRRDEAIKSIEQAIEIEPSFKEQGEYFINEIKAGRNP